MQRKTLGLAAIIALCATIVHADTAMDPGQLTVELRTDMGKGWCGRNYYVEVINKADSWVHASRRYEEKPPLGHGPGALIAKGLGSMAVITVASIVTLGKAAEPLGNRLAEKATGELMQSCGSKARARATDFLAQQKEQLQLALNENRRVSVTAKGELQVLPRNTPADEPATPNYRTEVRGRVVKPESIPARSPLPTDGH